MRAHDDCVRWVVCWVCLVFAGCAATNVGPEGPVASCFVGDSSAAAEIVPVYRTPAPGAQAIDDTGVVPLAAAPQGGQVLFVGVRARNLDGCPLNISTALLRADSDVVVSLERRPVNLEKTSDGWLQPMQASLSNFSNLAACPKAGLSQSIDGHSYRLQIVVDDPTGRHVEVTRTIIPTCAPDATLCRCQCSPGYVLGGACP